MLKCGIPKGIFGTGRASANLVLFWVLAQVALASDPIQLPLEVMGANGAFREVTLTVPEGAECRPCHLFVRFHGVNYNGQASMQWGEYPWVPLDETNPDFQVKGLARVYGGIGGGFSSFPATLALGDIGPGRYVVRFRFNSTDGVSSGYRILALNLIQGEEKMMGPESFTEDDPQFWAPPYADEASIQQGKELWYNAQLTVPVKGEIKARCADCHAHDGRDLKYFNYSNFAIRSRAMFHGLSEEDGDRIASYIRSLSVPSPGRPWNPPYQPGPGMDSKPVAEWAAGAGLDWVLSEDKRSLEYLFPNGIEAGPTSPRQNSSAREIPVSLQFPDWNHWLPQIHPKDAFPGFETSGGQASYERLRRWLRPQDARSYLVSRDVFAHWGNLIFDHTRRFPRSSGTDIWLDWDVRAQYSARQWWLTKTWELFQEFELEEMSRDWFGPQADSRAWNNAVPFATSPHIVGIPPGAAGLKNGTKITHQYLSMVWYHVQLILNNSNKRQAGTTPIDWPYVFGFIKDLTAHSPQAGLLTLWQVKGGQISPESYGPEFMNDGGWNWSVHNIFVFTHPDLWRAWRSVSVEDRNRIFEIQLRYWLDVAKSFRPEQFYVRATKPSEAISYVNMFDSGLSSKTLWTIRKFREAGIDPALVSELCEWAQSLWPSVHNWMQEAR